MNALEKAVVLDEVDIALDTWESKNDIEEDTDNG